MLANGSPESNLFLPNSNFTYFRKKKSQKFVLLSVRDFRMGKTGRENKSKVSRKVSGSFEWVGGCRCGCVFLFEFAQFQGDMGTRGPELSLIRWHVCKMARCVSGIHFLACQKDGRIQDRVTTLARAPTSLRSHSPDAFVHNVGCNST